MKGKWVFGSGSCSRSSGDQCKGYATLWNPGSGGEDKAEKAYRKTAGVEAAPCNLPDFQDAGHTPLTTAPTQGDLPELPACTEINLCPSSRGLVRETTGYYNLAADVIQIPEPEERQGRPGHAEPRPAHPCYCTPCAKEKGPASGGQVKLTVACDSNDHKGLLQAHYRNVLEASPEAQQETGSRR